MRTKTIDVPDWAHGLLRNAVVAGTTLRIEEKLNRVDYVGITKILEALGGKWSKKLKAHVFPEEPRGLIERALGDGSVKVDVIPNKKQNWGQFFTPQDLADRMVHEAQIGQGVRVLEPSAGAGAILDNITLTAEIAAVEIDPELAAKLKEDFPHVNVHCADFLECGFRQPYDRIVMNPPFSMGVDVKHILHARSMLAPGGRLVAICGGGPNSESRLRAQAMKWEVLPEKTFKESGTGVRSALLVMEAE